MSSQHILKHQQLGLTDEDVLKMYAYMLKARKFDERATLLQRSGKTAFIFPVSAKKRHRWRRRSLWINSRTIFFHTTEIMLLC